MSDDLPRYGLQWNGPERPVATPMPDGFWTPYHVAADHIEALERENTQLKALQDDDALTAAYMGGSASRNNEVRKLEREKAELAKEVERLQEGLRRIESHIDRPEALNPRIQEHIDAALTPTPQETDQ